MPGRRQFLSEAGGGCGLLALQWLLAHETKVMGAVDPIAPTQARSVTSPLAPKSPHFEPRARNVIWLFMHGGPSHVDTFDPKPELERLAGEPLPPSFGPVSTRRNVGRNPLLQARRAFVKWGESGLPISTYFTELCRHADKLAVVRSCWADSVNHPQAVYQMNTGSILMGKPSLGSWTGYGLGTENQDLPAFVVMPDPSGGIKGGPPAYGSGFLPATYQGTVMRGGSAPILDLARAKGATSERQRRMLDLVGTLNRHHLVQTGPDERLESRIANYELAYRMQSEAPEAVDITRESAATRRLYGLDDSTTADFGARCLLARRLVERGVRFVQLYSGNIVGWDAHEDVEGNHSVMARRTDKPIAGLLDDLHSRGLLETTLVIWGGEFGRMPMSEQGKGRDHNPHGFTVWMAGGGIKAGVTHGATDEIGLRAAVDRVHVNDLHATILHLLGLDHENLTFLINGREERLTQNAGKVVHHILT